MALLVNIDVPDLEAGVAFYTAAFGLTVGRRFGGEVVELTGWPAPLYLLAKAAGTVGAGDSRRDYARHWTPVHLDVVVDDVAAAPWPRAGSAPRSGAGWRRWPTRSGTGCA
jgi:catechol 2,3-dioxygenase-like lactoylglutathione lyase family enzyme